MLSLELLKKELAVATLQQKLGKQVGVAHVVENEMIAITKGRRESVQNAA